MAILKKNLIIYVIIGVVIAGVISFSFLFPSQPQKEPEAPIIILGERNLFEEALTLFNDKKYQEAIEKYREFLNKYPDSLRADDALLSIGQSQRYLGKNEEALSTFQKLMDNYPNSDNIPDALYHSAEIYLFVKNRPEKAEEYYDRILKDYPEAERWIIDNVNEIKPEISSRSFLLGADFLFYEQKTKEALEKYQEFLNRYPDSSLTDNVLLHIGLCYQRLKKNDEALLSFQKLIDNYPNSIRAPDALYYSAVIYSEKNDLKRVKEYCDRILKEYPDTREWIINGAKKLLEELNK